MVQSNDSCLPEKEDKISMDRKSRRNFINALGWGVFLSTIGGIAVATVRFLVPNVLYEQPKKFKIGYPKDYPEGVHFISAQRIFVLREDKRFRAVSAVCTHLGCTMHWSRQDLEWKCPCHGSIFNNKGGVVKGPANRPLPWYGVSASSDGQLLVDLNQFVSPEYSLTIDV
jgi:cytochrome b6-f complex iron-sulfur subunit